MEYSLQDFISKKSCEHFYCTIVTFVLREIKISRVWGLYTPFKYMARSRTPSQVANLALIVPQLKAKVPTSLCTLLKYVHKTRIRLGVSQGVLVYISVPVLT